MAWIRQASLLFGSTTFSLSTVLAVFFLGLAIGSYLFGRLGQHLDRPLYVFALIEIGVGLLAFVSPYAFEWMDSLYGIAYRSLTGHTALLFLTRAFLVGLVILPPTILMGGTLPLFCRQFVRSDNHIARSVGLLYGVNTLGAALGCVIAGFVLLPQLGLINSVRLGAMLNILVGLTVSRLNTPPSAAKIQAPSSVTTTPAHWGIFALFFGVGFTALGGEVLWTRYLGLFLANTVYTYTITLSVVLIGLVLGSVLASRFFDATTSSARYFGALQVLAGLIVLSLMMLPPDTWRHLGGAWWVYACLLLPPAVLGGASFPLAVRMAVHDAAHVAAGTGKITAVNTLGGIVGSMAIGFVGLPFLGLETSLLFITGVNLTIGFAAWLWLDHSCPRPLKAALLIVSSGLWLGIPHLADTHLPADFLGDRKTLVAYREGYGSNLAVLRTNQGLQLEINRWWQGRDRKTHQIMAAHVPMLLHPNPKRVLVVGVGTGQTAARFLLYPIEQLACVDIEPTIFEFIRSHFDAGWMADPRVELLDADGRNYLRHTPLTYDVISLELGQLSRPGVASFYTIDFYRRAQQRLRSGGLLIQFIPISLLTVDHFRNTVASFLEVFPQSLLWYNTSELLLIGVAGQDLMVDPAVIAKRLATKKIHHDLAYSHWGGAPYQLNQLEVFLGGYLMGSGGLANLADGGTIYRDDRPVLDYAVASAFNAKDNAIPTLKLLQNHLEPLTTLTPLTAKKQQAIKKIRVKNLGGIAADAAIRQAKPMIAAGDYQRSATLLASALKQLPEHLIVRRTLADVLMRVGRFEEARGHYAYIVELDLQDAQAQDGLGLALHQLGRLAEAVSHYQAALSLEPDRAATCSNLGGALAQQGKLEEALPYLEKAIQLKPDYADAKRNLAQVRAVLQKRKSRK